MSLPFPCRVIPIFVDSSVQVVYWNLSAMKPSHYRAFKDLRKWWRCRGKTRIREFLVLGIISSDF
ncbi:unnamed protein product [Brassica rapa subsp. trilocularis]